MKLRYLTVLGLMALGLVSLEVALEYRAYRRGFASILFGPQRVRFTSVAPSFATDAARLGPTDEFPFRSPVLVGTPEDGTVRIWLGSASHAEDLAVPVQGLFPNRMGEILTEGGLPTEVLNASRAGLIIAGNTRDLRERGPDWTPDYALLYGMGGDITELSQWFLGGHGPVSNPGQSREDGEALGDVVSGPFLRLNELHERTTLYAQLKANITSLITLERVLAQDLPSEAVAVFRDRIHDFLRAAEEVGAVPVLITFATSHSFAAIDELPRDARKYFGRYNPYLSPRGWLKAAREFNEVLRKIAQERGVLLLDLDSRLTDEAHFFRDPVHFTPAGHEEAAAFLAGEFLRAMGRGAEGNVR